MIYSLAPLAGFTDAPFRRLCTEGGCDETYTEMVSAAGLAHNSSPTRHLMMIMPSEGRTICQIFGSKVEDIALATREVSAWKSTEDRRFAAINLNAGCPMTKVTREGAGAKLIEDPKKIGVLLKTMRENTDLPITLKTRLGPHPQKIKIFEIVERAAEAGASEIIVHARWTSQMHGGPIDLKLLKEVVEMSPMPVIGNGSVVDAKTAKAMAATGVKGIMIGRAALAKPWIFNEIKGKDLTNDRDVVMRRHLDYLLEFRKMLLERFPNDHIPSEDGFVSVKMHTHLFRYFNGLPGAAKIRAKMNSVRTLAEVLQILSLTERAFSLC